VICHHEQTELRDAQTSSGKRCVISLRDPARRGAHGETNAIAAFVQLRKVSLPPHVALLSRLRLCTTALYAGTGNSKGAVQKILAWRTPSRRIGCAFGRSRRYV
jgi:hypothetical protein